MLRQIRHRGRPAPELLDLVEHLAPRTAEKLPIHLLDTEADVRLLAAQHTPLTDDARRRLAELRDDPIEEEQIRNAAAERTKAT